MGVGDMHNTGRGMERDTNCVLHVPQFNSRECACAYVLVLSCLTSLHLFSPSHISSPLLPGSRPERREREHVKQWRRYRYDPDGLLKKNRNRNRRGKASIEGDAVQQEIEIRYYYYNEKTRQSRWTVPELKQDTGGMANGETEVDFDSFYFLCVEHDILIKTNDGKEGPEQPYPQMPGMLG